MAVNTGLENLQNEVFEDLIAELGNDVSCDKEKGQLLSKVKNAIREVKGIREYPDSYTDEQIAKDMFRYYSNIRRLALYDYNQIGVEGQVSHSETGESRSWADRGDCLKGVLSEFAFEKKLSSGRIWKADVYTLVKSAQECLVELGVGTARIEVSRRNDKHGGLAVVLKAIQFREQRIGQIVRMLGGGILSHAVAGDRVDLVNEQDGGCVPPCRGKGFAQLLRAFSHPSA